MSVSVRRALVSVSDKSGLAEFSRGLVDLGFQIVSTGGTRRHLLEQGLPVLDVAEYTGFPEMMDGRLKTLHPKVHGAILGRPTLAEDAASMQAHGIIPFELVVCNLYPFEATVAKPGVTHEEAVENIDIGGPSMVRSAAKNHAHVAVVTRADQYAQVLEALKAGSIPLALRQQLAAAAFDMTARYDTAIAAYMAKYLGQNSDAEAEKFPAKLELSFVRKEELRYGENPHQSAAFYVESNAASGSLATATQLHGKELSYNNLLDLDAAWNLVRGFDDPAAVVLKHNNPCGAGIADTLAEAFDRAYAGDPVSAFGSILGFNRTVDLATAEQLCLPDRFIEAIIAPDYDADALQALTTRPKWKANVRLLKAPLVSGRLGKDYRRVSGGLLVQDADDKLDIPTDWKLVTTRPPSPQEWSDLAFAWSVVRHVKSNAIVIARGGMLTGVGAGQMSRVDSVEIAVKKSAARSPGASLASDAFFPFRDGVDAAAAAGVTAIVQPGGSRNDADAIAACNERGMAMVFTGVRHFKH